MRFRMKWLAGLALALTVFSVHAASKDVILPGDAKCTKCHDETESYPVLSMGKTRHGVMVDGRLPTCTGCHGNSETHTNKPEGVKIRPLPEFPYGKRTADDVGGHNQVCADCHKGGKFMDWNGSIHAARDVPCTSCHQLHVAKDKVRDKRTQAEVCFTCHKEQRVLFNKPSHHPVPEGKVACSDCHASHGSAGPKLMTRDSIANTCFTCHMEKRGPFVRKHEPAEDCTICHNPHGAATDNLLKVRSPMLCQQCHEPSSHRGNFPSFAAGASTGGLNITQARGCLNCHTNIHGTNNPANAGNERTFRR
ncbi:MAG: cytochrome C [Rhodocyclales bacterium RIFCSPLOWO2_02_FULL_63_24]|nr:MAG: cytochrome C [Rhodocyclales bacterium GWA2_65_19]OHC71096.1 MAG: cytochrome C [Rhodocyclales bacterium RIFCSPLOWO2_02_FULL_63_24]